MYKYIDVRNMDNPQNPCSIYYLYLRENPGMIFINIQLNGANYHTWSKVIRRALLSKKKLQFIDKYLIISQQGTLLYEA